MASTSTATTSIISTPSTSTPSTSTSPTSSPQVVTDWGNTLYEGASDVGLFTATLYMIITLIIGLVLIVIGIYMIISDNSGNYTSVQGTVIQSDCSQSTTSYDDKGRSNVTHKCDVVVSYNINNMPYSKRLFLSGSSTYSKDEPIDLFVNKNDLTDAQIAWIGRSYIGSCLMIVALIVTASAYLNYYMTHNYKIYAAGQGTATIYNLFKN